MQFTTEQRIFMVKTYFEHKSYEEVRRLFSIQFPERDPPTKAGIWKNVTKYLNYGTSLNRNVSNSGRKRTGRSDENVNLVQQALEDHPRDISCRRNGLGLPSATFNRIVKLDLKWHPYRIRRRHELKVNDYARRQQFCEWFLDKNRDHRFLHNLVISDEAGFHMNGTVCSQNVREYAPKGDKPEFTYDVNSSKEKCMVWMGLTGGGVVLGPFFFVNNVTGASYLQLLNDEVFPQLLANFANQFGDGQFSRLWWAQDGAPAHNSVVVSEWMHEFFGEKVIALRHPREWPPRSPDLTPCDFFYGVT